MKRVLIANRGEIAVRIARSCRALGIETVAVHSEADAAAPHVLAADLAVGIGPPPAAESYLDVQRVLEAARETGADAIHPGYGFLSENADFARAVADAGLIWIGPSPESIEEMGSKIASRRAMEAAGVPVVPGMEVGDDTPDEIVAAAKSSIGFPVLVKASAGGGGKGMRAVHDPKDLPAALEGARREAASAFGDGTVYLEKLLVRPRHVEIQVFGDSHGHAVHLMERECSIQRRHQKILEETPSPALDEALRQQMGEAAVAAAQAVDYVGAGTVEFMLTPDGDFYFLEMNTRLQVEHPITEEVLGVDLVAAQIAVARGEALPWRQEDLEPRGHAIEVRLYAEDPSKGFLPATGRLLRYRPPEGPGIRHDGGVAEGGEVGTYYDPMLAKLIARGATRREAIGRMREALSRWEIHGVVTNLGFLLQVLDHPTFEAGDTHTGFIDEEMADVDLGAPEPDEDALIAVALADRLRPGAAEAPVGGGEGEGDPVSPWRTLGAWRGVK
ncbi:MAG: acetyl-CoA carboxylase biotin carboxylase subunit [Myxococcota bacterium]